MLMYIFYSVKQVNSEKVAIKKKFQNRIYCLYSRRLYLSNNINSKVFIELLFHNMHLSDSVILFIYINKYILNIIKYLNLDLN